MTQIPAVLPHRKWLQAAAVVALAVGLFMASPPEQAAANDAAPIATADQPTVVSILGQTQSHNLEAPSLGNHDGSIPAATGTVETCTPGNVPSIGVLPPTPSDPWSLGNAGFAAVAIISTLLATILYNLERAMIDRRLQKIAYTTPRPRPPQLLFVRPDPGYVPSSTTIDFLMGPEAPPDGPDGRSRREALIRQLLC